MRRWNLLAVAVLAAVALADEPCVVGNARFSFPLPGVVRMEYSPEGVFADAPSAVFSQRAADSRPWRMSNVGDCVVVTDGNLSVRYCPGAGRFAPDNLEVFWRGARPGRWVPGQVDPLNLGGTVGSLDRVGEHNLPKLPPGLVSRSGWAFVDDSGTPLLDETGWVRERPSPGALDWYLFVYGTDYRKVLSDFAALSGPIPMIPRWALGSWYSRYWPYSDRELREIVMRYRIDGIPLDVLVIDVDWHLHGWEGYDWNPDLFPDPEGFLQWCHKQGLRVTLNNHPGVLPVEDSHYPAVAERLGWEPRGEPIRFNLALRHHADAFMDELHLPLVRQGIDFWWIDGAAAYFPGLNSQMWTRRVYYEGTVRHTGERGLIFARWGGLGSHRYPVGFSGDTFSEWGVLRYQQMFTPTAGNVLEHFWSHDVGGFLGKKLPTELYVRWVQFGALSPILRLHSDHGERLPWLYGEEAEAIVKRWFLFRYRLIPYLYTLCWKAHTDASPLLYPMYLDLPELDEAYRHPYQYMLGPSLLVAPADSPGVEGVSVKRVFFPEGVWYDLFSGDVVQGPVERALRVPLDGCPVFGRAGALLPMGPEMNYSTEKPVDPLTVLAFAGADGSFELYEDDGTSLEYASGAYATTPLRLTSGHRGCTLTVGPTSGRYEGQQEERALLVQLRGTFLPEEVLVDGVALTRSEWMYDPELAETSVSLPPSSIRRERVVEVRALVAPDLLARLRGNLALAEAIAAEGTTRGTGPLAARLSALEAAADGGRALLSRSVERGEVQRAVVRLESALRLLEVELGRSRGTAAEDLVRTLASPTLAVDVIPAEDPEQLVMRATLVPGPVSPPYALRLEADLPSVVIPVEGTVREAATVSTGEVAVLDFPFVRTPGLSLGEFSFGARGVMEVMGKSLPVEAATKLTFAAVREFLVIGPFDNTDNAGMSRPYPPEQGLSTSEWCEGVAGKVGWKRVVVPVGLDEARRVSAFVDLGSILTPRDNVVAYALTVLRSAKEQDVVLSVGSDDGFALWVNGVEVAREEAPRPASPGQNQVPVRLREGGNVVLMKVGQVLGGWGFYLDVLAPGGGVPEGVSVRLPAGPL